MQGDQVHYIDVGNLKRRYVAHVPPDLPATKVPLVIMLEGRGGTPWTAMKITGWSQLAGQEGFIVAYPEALRLDPHGPQHFLDNPQMWNAGGNATDAGRGDVDDHEFLTKVIQDLVARFPVDATRVFMTGFSNGAVMTFSYASKQRELLRAIAPVSGHCLVQEATISHPIPTLYLFGRQDPLSPYDGGIVELPWGRTEWRPEVMTSVRRWARLNGCPGQPWRTDEEQGVFTEIYGATGSETFIFMSVPDLGHVWPGGVRLLPESLVGSTSERVNATRETWEFFKRS